MNKKLVSIIIPCYNEEKNIDRFEKELLPFLKSEKYNFEVIAIDDGSNKDKTWESLTKISHKNPNFISLKHTKNYGMGAAYQTGFDEARGDFVITFSSDLETNAKYIFKVIEKLEEGYDVVNTYRKGRWNESKKGSILRKIPSNIANYFIRNISGVDVKDTGSGLKGFKQFVVQNLKIYGDMHRFLPAYASQFTKKIVEFPVEYQERTYGKSAYGSIKRTFAVFLDLVPMKFLLSFSTKPFTMMPGRIFGTFGFLIMIAGLFIVGFLFLEKIILGADIGTRPLFIVGLLFCVVGIQLILNGLLGELLLRIYYESSNRKPYLVGERVTSHEKNS